ncbi:MAG: ogr/Delta-like zinc finger family protein [Desulfobacterales bacterium]
MNQFNIHNGPSSVFPLCPHCGHKMRKWKVPIASTWPHEFFYVCFNNACSYFLEGWKQMWEQQATRASYRCRLDPDSGKYLPLPVWSYDALKEDIIE